MDKGLRELCGSLYKEASSIAGISPDEFDALVELVQESARRLLVAAIDLEFRHFQGWAAQPDLVEGRGNAVVRNGLHPERMIGTGIGTVPVRLPKVRVRTGARRAFRSALVPRYTRQAQLLNADSTDRYVRAIASGDLTAALTALVGTRAFALPPPVTRELERWWSTDCAALRCRIRDGFWSALAYRDPDATRPGTYGAPPPKDSLRALDRVHPPAYTKIDRPFRSFESRRSTEPSGEGD